jgi:DNA-binding PadR family transcriptional regulator
VLSAKYAILGLVIERPGYGYQLAQRMQERFGSSAFAPSGVYSALDQLSRDRLVRCAGEMGAGPARRAAPRMIYEATSEGTEHFEAWMLGSSPAPPLRDELHMKIALCRPRNLPRLIDMVYGQELACISRLRDLTELNERDAAAEQEWGRMMRVLTREAEIALWRSRVEWLQGARELLAGLVEDPTRAARVAAPQRAAVGRAVWQAPGERVAPRARPRSAARSASQN